jgi:ribonuclease HI
MHFHFDGGCKPNPGIMEVAVVIPGAPPVRHHQRLGQGTNNEAEWIALLWAMEIARDRSDTRPGFYGDSQLIVNQANGVWKVHKEHLKPYVAEFHRLRQNFQVITIHYVPRAQNLAGIFLERLGG